MKRAYDGPTAQDGYLVLVDRLWPRGVKKTELQVDDWAKELAPSSELRRWYGHDPSLWPQFQRRYRAELRAAAARRRLQEIARRALRQHVTLVFSAKDEEHSNAAVLKGLLAAEMRRLRGRTAGAPRRGAAARRRK